jgi:hypothetical protein
MMRIGQFSVKVLHWRAEIERFLTPIFKDLMKRLLIFEILK